MASISHLLNKDVTVKRQGVTADGQGGFTDAFSPIASTKGRRAPASGRDRIVAGREEAEVTHVWYFDPGQDIRVRDQLESGSGTVTDEVMYNASPSKDDHMKFLVKEIQVGATT